MMLRNQWVLRFFLLLAGTLALRAHDENDWVQVHADIEYVRTGTPATSKDGKFTFVLKASFDQLLVRVAPAAPEIWPDYVLLDEFPRTGKLSGSVSLEGDARMDQFSAHAALKSALSSLDDLWITEIKPQPLLFPGLGAEIRVAAKLAGTVTCNLPGDASNPDQAIFVWPTPVKYETEISSFLSEGTLYVFPPLGPRPKGTQEGMIYDVLKASTDEALPGVGGLSAPSVGAVLKGTPDKWELTLTREAKPELNTGGEYSHKITITLRLVPKTLPTPKAKPAN